MVQIELPLLSTADKPHIFFLAVTFASMPFGMCFFTPLYLTSIMRWFSIKVQRNHPGWGCLIGLLNTLANIIADYSHVSSLHGII